MNDEKWYVKCPECGEITECYYNFHPKVHPWYKVVKPDDYPVGKIISKSNLKRNAQFFDCPNCQGVFRLKEDMIVKKEK